MQHPEYSSKNRNADGNYCSCNKSLFYYTILIFPVVCDIDFIVITGNILRSVNEIPIVIYTGNIVIRKIVIPGFCPIHFTTTFAGQTNLDRYTEDR